MRIILGLQEHSDTFKLEKGHAQGDSPSPLLYNFAVQILLFRIELDKEIKPIRPPRIGLVRLFPLLPLKKKATAKQTNLTVLRMTIPSLPYLS